MCVYICTGGYCTFLCIALMAAPVKKKPLPPTTLDDNSSECDTDDEIER